jgi:hypothetical protein
MLLIYVDLSPVQDFVWGSVFAGCWPFSYEMLSRITNRRTGNRVVGSQRYGSPAFLMTLSGHHEVVSAQHQDHSRRNN